MNKTLAIIALLAGAASAYSQGQVNFTDYISGANGFNIHIWSPSPAFPIFEQTGNTVNDSPPGTATYGGVPVGGGGNGSPAAQAVPNVAASGYTNGDNFTVELYAAAGEATSFSALSPIPATAVNSYLADAISGGGAGEFQNLYLVNLGSGGSQVGTPGAPFVTQGSPATFAIVCWFNNDGTVTTLAAAQAAGVPYAWSPLGAEDVEGGPGNKTPPLNLPGAGDSYTLAGAGAPPGITSFSFTGDYGLTPEPSPLVLTGIGGLVLALFRRRFHH